MLAAPPWCRRPARRPVLPARRAGSRIFSASAPASATSFSGFMVTSAELGLEARLLQRGLHLVEIGRRADHLDRAVLVRHHVVGARLERRLHDLVLARAGREHELAAMLEQERHRAVGADVAAVLGEGVAHLGDGARAVVGEAVHHHRRAAGAVALVARLLVGHALQLAGAALDGARHAVLGHVGVARLVEHQAQLRIGVRIAAARRAATVISLIRRVNTLPFFASGRRLAVLDVRPFAVTGHAIILASWPRRSSSRKARQDRAASCCRRSPTATA